MRPSKLALLLVCVLVLAGVGNALLIFALEPIASNSEMAWKEYGEQEELDTLIIGSSHVQQDIDPAVLDEKTGWKSFNLGVPSQTMPETLAAIRTAYEDHGIKRVVLGLSPNTLTGKDAPDPGKAFLRWRATQVPITETIATTSWLLFEKGAWLEPDSLNVLAPWVTNHVEFTWKKIRQNVKLKLNDTPLKDAVKQTQKTWTYYGKGYGARNYQLDYSGKRSIPYFEPGDASDAAAYALADNVDSATINIADGMTDRAMNDLAELLDYCNAHDIEVYAIFPPFPVYNILYAGQAYYDFSSQVRIFVENHGAHFCDFNLAKPEFCDIKPDDFADSEHLMAGHGVAFTEALAQYMLAVSSYEPTRDWFYTPSEHFNSVPYISTLLTTAYITSDSVNVHASAVASPGVEAEYRYLAKQGGDWVEVQAWSQDKDCSFTPDAHGTVSIRVETREVGNDAAFERYRESSVLY